jgi:toxin ParE1/3/4
MKLVWTEKASRDALSIHAYISEHSETYADSVYERMLARPNQLIAHPESGSVVPECGRQDLRELFLHSFRIIYLLLPDEIHILTIVHGARILDFHMPQEP